MVEINKIIENFTSQLKQKNINLALLKKEKFNNIFFIGLGGSALGAKMLIELKDQLDLKKETNLTFYEGYSFKSRLPKRKTLAIIVSYSGNTKEVLKLAKDLRKQGAKLIFVSTDGKLKKLSARWNIDFIEMSKTFSPRFSLGEQFYILYGILEKLSIATKKLPDLSKIKTKDLINEAKKISTGFKKNEIILIYSLKTNSFLAYDLKIRLNEDAKNMAFSNHLPEAVHNEFLSLLPNKNKTKLIFILGEKKCLFKKHIKAIFEELKKNKIPFKEIRLKGKNIRQYFNQIIFNISFSYFITKKNNQDLLENSFLKDIKKRF